jgi:hypothetical protein
VRVIRQIYLANQVNCQKSQPKQREDFHSTWVRVTYDHIAIWSSSFCSFITVNTYGGISAWDKEEHPAPYVAGLIFDLFALAFVVVVTFSPIPLATYKY